MESIDEKISRLQADYNRVYGSEGDSRLAKLKRKELMQAKKEKMEMKNKSGTKIKDYLKQGTQVELEHKHTIEKIKNNPNISVEKAAELIAKDHLKEDPKYYEKLEVMEMEKGNSFKVNPKYSYFAISKRTNKIVDGWEIVDDVESLKYYAKIDLKDNYPDNKVSDFKILSAKELKSKNIDPYNWGNWRKTGEQMKKGKKIALSYAQEVKAFEKNIKSDYGTNSGELVWENWTLQQKFHFLFDHKLPVKYELVEYYSDLPKEVKFSLVNHIRMGRYKTGGKFEYTNQLEQLKKDGRIINPQPFGVEIDFNVDEKFIMLTNNEMISMIINSYKTFEKNISDENILNLINIRTKYMLKKK